MADIEFALKMAHPYKVSFNPESRWRILLSLYVEEDKEIFTSVKYGGDTFFYR